MRLKKLTPSRNLLLPSARLVLMSLVSLEFFISACTSSPQLKDLPQQAILRRATLPEGVSQWHLIFGHAFDYEPNSTIYPLYWEQGFSSRLTLVWIPIPFEARYLVAFDESQWVSLGLALLGSVKSREKGFNWRPALTVTARKRFSDSFAIEETLFIHSEIKRSLKNSFGRTIGLDTAFIFQITSAIALKPVVTVMQEVGENQARYLGAVPRDALGEASQAASRIRFPLGLNAYWSLSRQFEIVVEMQYFSLGYEAGYRGLPVYLSLVHSW